MKLYLMYYKCILKHLRNVSGYLSYPETHILGFAYTLRKQSCGPVFESRISFHICQKIEIIAYAIQ